MNRTQQLVAAVAAVSLVLVGAMGAFILSGGSGSPSPQSVHAQQVMQDRGISVEGHGQISVLPDVANVTLGVELEGSDLDSMRSDANERMNDIIDALQELGIEEQDIQTIVYDIWVKDDWMDPRPPEPLPDTPVTDEPDAVEEDEATTEEDDSEIADDDEATTEDDDSEATDDDEDITEEDEEQVAPDTSGQTYVLTQLVQVRIADIDMTGDVIDTALDSGANRVSNISFEVEDRQDAVEQARELAVEEARAKAEHLAELTGVSAGAPLRIDESSPFGPVMQMDDFAMEDMAADGEMSRIEPGEQVVSVHVYITYAIE
jgi:uncharacterized protein YggE